MALENNAQKARRLAYEKMPKIIKATVAGSYVYTEESVYSVLVKKGFVEINEAITDSNGGFATRATELGIKEFPLKEESKPMFQIENVPVVPVKRKRSGVGSIYPFDALEVGQSFFVPASADKPEPWKSMASTIGSAMRRFAVPEMDATGAPVMRTVAKGPAAGSVVPKTVNTRIFISAEDTLADGTKGARIGRTV